MISGPAISSESAASPDISAGISRVYKEPNPRWAGVIGGTVALHSAKPLSPLRWVRRSQGGETDWGVGKNAFSRARYHSVIQS